MTGLADGSSATGDSRQDGFVPVTELRIHGVGGTDPETLLRNPHVRRVSGDREAGFYRPASGDTADSREALSWGGLTSRDASRALWLLLLPFALVNMAGWMQHPGSEDDRAAGSPGWESPARGLVRLFALSMTLLVVAATASIGLDLIAFQCGGAACADQQWWTTPLARIGPDQPARRLAVGALLPLAALLVVWFAGLRSYRSLERFEVPRMPLGKRARGLAHPDFWRGAEPVARLRVLHVAAGMAAVAALLAWSAVTVDTERGERPGLAGLVLPDTNGTAVAALSLLLIGGIAVLLCNGILSQRSPNPGLKRWLRAIIAASALAVLLALLYAVLPRTAVEGAALPSRSLQGFVTAAGAIAAGQLLLAAGMVMVCWRRRGGAPGAAFLGFGQPFVCALAAMMLASLWAGSFIRLTDILGTPVAADLLGDVPATVELPAPFLVYPPWYRSVSVGFSATLVALLAAVAVEGARAALGVTARAAQVRRDFCEQLRERFPEIGSCPKAGTASPPLDRPLDSLPFTRTRPPAQAELAMQDARLAERRIAEVARSYGLADVVVRADRWLLLAGALGVVGAALEVRFGVPSWLLTGSTWLVAWVPLVASATLFGALRSPERRRGVAVLFDVLTFWPRLHHPFAPPCYGERLIPQLAARLRRLTCEGTEPGRVLLSAHSQGTVVAAACLLQEDLPEAATRQIELLTYGSPLVILYQRAFPAYFGATTLAELRERLCTDHGVSRWQHYYCPTDPLGVPMFSSPGQPEDPDDHRLMDPHTLLAPLGEPPLAMLRHSAYLDHPVLQRALAHRMGRAAP